MTDPLGLCGSFDIDPCGPYDSGTGTVYLVDGVEVSPSFFASLADGGGLAFCTTGNCNPVHTPGSGWLFPRGNPDGSVSYRSHETFGWILYDSPSNVIFDYNRDGSLTLVAVERRLELQKIGALEQIRNTIGRFVDYLASHPVTLSFNEIAAVQVTYQHSTRITCVNVGVGASVPPTKMFTVGILNAGDMHKWTDVVSGPGYAFGANAILGYQGMFNSSGKVGGPSISGPGLSGSYTFGDCGRAPW